MEYRSTPRRSAFDSAVQTPSYHDRRSRRLILAALAAVSVVAAAGAAQSPAQAAASSAGRRTAVSSVVHKTNGYQIGAYYFSGWSHGQNNNLNSLLTTGPLARYEPLISWYDDSQSQVDLNITQAANAGINFFAFDWYRTTLSPYKTDQTLNEGLNYFMTSSQRPRMNFALNFVDQAPFLPKAKVWPDFVKIWISYFKQPDYVRVGGKPLFIVFSPENMRTIFGSSKNVSQALAYLRSRAVAAGLPGVTIAIGASLGAAYNPVRVPQLRGEGYDILTGYNYHAFGNERYRVPAPYSNLVKENQQMWDRVLKYGKPYIPVVTSGWDQRFSQREQSTAIIYEGRTPSQFYCYAASARRWVDAHPKNTVKEKMVMIFAWNETGEGGEIIPTKVDRYGYTTALKSAFTVSRVPSC